MYCLGLYNLLSHVGWSLCEVLNVLFSSCGAEKGAGV